MPDPGSRSLITVESFACELQPAKRELLPGERDDLSFQLLIPQGSHQYGEKSLDRQGHCFPLYANALPFIVASPISIEQSLKTFLRQGQPFADLR
jgi:hypothetical protein